METWKMLLAWFIVVIPTFILATINAYIPLGIIPWAIFGFIDYSLFRWIMESAANDER